MTEKSKICRLCLQTILNNVIGVDDIKLQMLKTVFPTVWLSVNTINSVMCDSCFEILQSCFEFKMTCLNNEAYLKPFRENNDQLVLKEIIPKTNLTEGVIKLEEESVCRLCLKYFDSNLPTINRIDGDYFLKDMMETCLPELNQEAIHDPLICYDCMQPLQNQFNLISTFMDTNDKIDAYVHHMFVLNEISNVDLHGVQEFIRERESLLTDDVKEEVKCEDISEDITHPEIHIKVELDSSASDEHEEVCSLGDECKGDSVDRTLQSDGEPLKTESIKKNSRGLYSCDECSYETTLRCSLRLHLQKHRSTIHFRCDKCNFVTKWRTSMVQHFWLHREMEMYQCTHCPYKTRYKKHLKRHGKRHGISISVGKKAQSFDCDRCDFVADKRCLLTQHCKREHKRLTCEHCGYQCNRLCHLKDHMLKHKSVDEVTMLKCTVCDFQTKYKKSWKTHLLTHGV